MCDSLENKKHPAPAKAMRGQLDGNARAIGGQCEGTVSTVPSMTNSFNNVCRCLGQ